MSTRWRMKTEKPETRPLRWSRCCFSHRPPTIATQYVPFKSIMNEPSTIRRNEKLMLERLQKTTDEMPPMNDV